MELELEAGGRINRVVRLSGDAETAELGRGDLGPAETPPADRTVSRRHVSLRFLGGGEHRVAFEVVGRNPVVVRSADGSRVYRRGEAGEIRAGDGLSLSLKAPSFWAVRRTNGDGDMDAAVLDAVARRERRTRERKEREREREMRAVEEAMEVTDEEETAVVGSGVLEVEVEVEDLKFDVASIDPVREFGFLSMGHEFDHYERGRIRPPEDWNWFLEEIRRSSDDEDDEVSNEGGKSKGSRSANKKKEGEGEDEAWTSESEDEKDSLSRGPNVKRPKYVTRSKDPKKPRKENPKVKKENMDDGDSEDETLGGFIVNEEDEPMEELSGEEEDEEEFDDEDDDD